MRLLSFQSLNYINDEGIQNNSTKKQILFKQYNINIKIKRQYHNLVFALIYYNKFKN